MPSNSDRAVLRKVYFFRVESFDTIKAGLCSAVSLIDDLPFTEEGRYLPTVSNDTTLALFVSRKSYPLRLQFARIRRSDLPLVEDGGKITPLQLATSAGVLDWGHIVVFDDGIVAAEFNRDAPRLARLGEYLLFKARPIIDSSIKFFPLFERAVLGELAKYDDVSILEVEASTIDAEAIAEADGNLGAAFAACRRASNARTAKLKLKVDLSKENSNFKDLADRLFRNPRSREAISKLQITGTTEGGRKPLNMLQDYLVSTESFVKVDGRTRAIASDDAFRVIEKAYGDNKHRFKGAATATEMW